MTDAQDKLREQYEKIKASTDQKKAIQEEGMKQAIVTLDSLRSKANIGMNNINAAEDIQPPKMFLVQGIKDKSELVDNMGNQCPDGKFYLKGLNEILEAVTGYFIWVKRDTYVKEGNKWSGSKMYKTIFVREKDMLPISIDFNKSNTNSLSDLFTAKMTQRYPLFAFKTEMKVMLAKNKDNVQFFKVVVNVKGLEEDGQKLTLLSQLAERFDQTASEEVYEEVSVEEKESQDLDQSAQEAFAQDIQNGNFVDSTDIPF